MSEDPKGKEPQDTEANVSEEKEITPTTPVSQPTSETSAQLREVIDKDTEGGIIERVSKSVTERVAKALGLTQKQEERLPTDADALKQLIDRSLNDRLERLSSKAREQEETAEKDYQQKVNSIVDGWNWQYQRLADSGKVPKIKDVNDRIDSGVQAKRKIILYIGKMIENLKAQGSNYVPTIADALLENPDVLSAPPGADLPISGNTAVMEGEDSFKYEDIASKSFEEIAQGI